jgi:hypothetical protein
MRGRLALNDVCPLLATELALSHGLLSFRVRLAFKSKLRLNVVVVEPELAGNVDGNEGARA